MKNFLINLWIFFLFFSKVSFSNDLAFITNQLSNSVSVIDLETYEVINEISVGLNTHYYLVFLEFLLQLYLAILIKIILNSSTWDTF